MKFLIVLLLIWCALTVNLALENLRIKEDNIDQINRRALLLFIGLKEGCMTGAYFANFNFHFTFVYSQCLNMAYEEKALYLKKWLPKDDSP